MDVGVEGNTEELQSIASTDISSTRPHASTASYSTLTPSRRRLSFIVPVHYPYFLVLCALSSRVSVCLAFHQSSHAKRSLLRERLLDSDSFIEPCSK